MEKSKTTNFGVHYMLDGYTTAPELLKNVQKLKKILNDVPTTMGMHAISEAVVVEVGEKNRKDPGGFSGFVLIAESHISFHTFPKRGFITIDVYTCQDKLDTTTLTKEFCAAFKLKDHDEIIVKRGTKYPVENIF